MNRLNTVVMDSADGSSFIKEMIDIEAVVPLCISGSSMMPTLRPDRDQVLLEKCSDSSFKLGQILLFERADGKLVLHRVRKKNGEKLIMNGDSQAWCEEIRKEQVIAAVSHIIRNGKKINVNCTSEKIRNILWYPTLIFRPVLKKIRKVFVQRRK